MKKLNYIRNFIGIIFMLILNNQLLAQSAGDYRSAASGSWNNATTWQVYDGISWLNAGVAPANTDGVITIQSPHTVTINSSVTADQVVVNSGATLDDQNYLTIVDGAGVDMLVNGTFNLNYVFSGNGTTEFTSGSTFNWIAYDLDQTGIINVDAGAVFNIISSNPHYFTNSGIINNYTTCTWTPGADLYLYYYAPTFNNYGTFDIQTDGDIYNVNNGTLTFNNQAGGILTKTAGTGETYFQNTCTYTNNGTIAVNSGTLTFQGNGTFNGVVNNGSAGTLNLSAGTTHVNTGASFIGSGTLTITGGHLSVEGNATVGGTCTISEYSGYIGNNATLDFNAGSTFNWYGGYAYATAPTGIINTNAGSVFNISSGSAKYFYGAIINNHTTCTWTGSDIYLYYYASEFNNYGTFDIQTDGDIYNVNNGTLTFNNQAGGILTKTTGTGETYFQSTCTYTNNGTIAVNSGTLTFQGNGTFNGVVNNGSAGTLNLSAGTTHVNTGASFIGSGTLTITGGHLSVEGNATVGGACTISEYSGYIGNNATLDFNAGSAFNWYGGYAYATAPTGIINTNAGSVFNISSGSAKYFYGAIINNHTTCTWTGSDIYLYYYASEFNNYGTFDIQTDGDIYNVNNGTLTFSNQAGGILTKTAGTGETYFQSTCTYTNNGTIAVNSGTLTFQGNGTFNGVVNNGSAGTLNLSAGTTHVNTGASFIGSGTLTITGGHLSVEGNATVGGTCTISEYSGYIGNNATLDFNAGSTFNWYGGYAYATAPTGIINTNAGSVFNISSGSAKYFYGAIINNHTTCTWTGSDIYLYYYASEFNNYGTFDIQTDGDIYNVNNGTLTFSNQAGGILTKTAGTGETYFQSTCTFNNVGTTNINSGTLSFYTSPNPHSGVYSIASGAGVYSPLAISYTGSSFINNGNVNFGVLNFNGASNQLLGGTGTINYLSFNSSAGVTLGGTQTINNSFSLTNGNVTMGNNNLIIGPSSSFTGGSSSSYFVTNGTGGLKRRVYNNNTDVFFPVGTASAYLPASVQLTGASTTDDFTARVINQLNFSYDGSSNPVGAMVNANVVGDAWVIKEDVAGGSNATVSLQWNSGDELSGFNRSNASIYNYDGSLWQHSSFIASGGSNPYTISRSGIISFREFAVSDNLSVLNFSLSCINNFYTVCQGSTIGVPYIAGGIFGGGNVFTAELSDATGSFASPTIIGLASATTSGTISATIPISTPAGTNYRIRITSSNPVVTSADNGSPITISGTSSIFYQDNDGDGYGNTAVSLSACSTPSGYVPDNTDCDDNNVLYHSIPVVGFTVSPFTKVCSGTAVTLSGTGAASYSWTGGITNGAAFVATSTATYTLTGSNGTGGCTNTTSATITVNALPTSTITAGGPTTFCGGGSVTLSGPGAGGNQRYVSSIIAFSSQYSTGAWSANQIIGTPDTYPSYGDIGTAWTSSTPDAQREYLVLGFASPAPIRFINIYETYRPGSIDTVYVKNPNTNLFEVVYSTTAAPAYDSARILHISFPLTSFNVSEIRIALNSPAVSSWNEIDAVAIGGGDSYVWSPGGSTVQSITATTSGSYTVTYTNNQGCSATSAATVVTVNPSPTIGATASPASTVCDGTSITLSGTGAVSYSWTNGLINGTAFTPPGAGSQTAINSTSASLLVGLRKLVSSYSGNAIQLRRSTDNAIMDFGFVGFDLDAAAITNWLGGATGYCSVLYDQSGSGHNVTQATTSYQPVYVPNGLNGRPILHFSSGHFMNNTTNFPAPFTVICGATQTGPTRGRVLSSTGNNWLLGWWSGYKSSAYFEGWVAYPSIAADNNTYVYSGTSNGSNSQVYENGSLLSNNSGGVVGPNGIEMGGSGVYGEYSDCDFMDVMIFNSSLSNTDRSAVESNIANYYLLPFANTTTSYTVTGTAANGCTGTFVQPIVVNPLPNVGSTATPSSSICAGNSVTLNGTGATSYSWTGGVTNGVAFSPSVTGSYIVTGTDGNGCTNADTTTVTVSAAISVNASASANTVCSAGSTTLSATGAATYTWMPGSLTGASVTVSPISTTTYTVTGMNGAGCSGTATVTIAVNPLPTVGYTASPTLDLCVGSSVTLNGTGAVSYSWSGGISNGVVFSPSTTTTYTVTGTDGNGCSNTATARVTVGGTYTLSTSSTNVNCGLSDGTATAIVTGGNIGSGSGLLSYLATTNFNSFYAGSTDLSFINDGSLSTGTIWNPSGSPVELTMTFASAIRLDSVKIKGGQYNGNYNIANSMFLYRGTSSGTLLSTIVPTYSYDNYSFANNQSDNVYTFVIPNNIGNYISIEEITCYGSTETYTYQWSANAANQTTPTATALSTGTYTITVTDANGCAQTASQNVTNASPLTIGVNVSPSANVCTGQSVTLSGTGAVSYSWTGGVTDGVAFSPSSTTTYTVTGTDGSGCTGTATQTITINPLPPVVASASSTAICIGSSTTLSATGAVTYSWLPGGMTGASVVVSPGTTTTYTVIGTNANGCVNTSTIQIVVNSLPPVTITPSGSTTFCTGGSVLLNAGLGYSSYLWSTGATSSNISVNTTGTYSITVTNSAGCANSASTVVTVVPPPTATASSNSPVCSGINLNLTASGGTTYSWTGPASYTSSSQNPVITGTTTANSGTYTVTVTSAGGCSATATTVASVTTNHAPTLTYTGNAGFVTDVVNPANGLPTAVYRFEVRYTDADGDMPANTYPRVQLDFEGNGSLADANDRLYYMLPVNTSDNDVTDGKDYYYIVGALPEGSSYLTTIVATDQSANACSATFGAFNEPDVQRDVDISIFANDISFSNPHPNPGDVITVFATIHNYSGRTANNFTAHLVNQFDTTVIYPDVTVSSLLSLPYNNSTVVSWTITTPALPAWCPMQVYIDYGNVLAEPNELDNQAIRPFVNGNYTLPGDIMITASPSPALVPSNGGINICGHAQYRGTAVALPDPSCAGATVTATITESGQTASSYTNSSGDYCIGFVAPVTAGLYHVNVTITDFTLNGDTATTFNVYYYTPPVCVAPNLVSAVSLSPGTVTIPGYNCTAILAGQSLTGTAIVTNAGNASSVAGATLQLSLPDGTPVPGPFVIPALNPGDSYTYNLPSMNFPTPVSTYISATADVNNVISECYEGDNSSSACILVLPPLPDIAPYNYSYGSAYQCQFGNISFGISNSGGVPTGSFSARLTVYHSSTPVGTYYQTVGSIGPLGNTSVSFAYVPPTTGVYDFVLDCDIPNAVTELNESNNSAAVSINMLGCSADLSVYGCGSLDVQPVDPTAGGNITIYATIANGGLGIATGPFDVDFDVAGVHYIYNFTGNLNPGASQQISMIVPAPAYGNNTLSVTADYTNVVAESNDLNNSNGASLCWDFAPTNSSCGGVFIGGTQFVGHPVTLATGLFNFGLYEASHAQVLFEVSGPGLTGWVNLGTVSTFADITCSCPIGLTLPGVFAFPQVGSYTVRITADYNNQYSECDETNNVIFVPVNVTNYPDYRVLSQYIAPSLLNPDVNQAITIDVTYENIGNGSTDSLEVYTQLDVTPHDSIRAPGIPGGTFNTVHLSQSWSSSLRGVHIIRAIADHNNEIVESNETNNEATRAIIVGQSPNLYFTNFAASNVSANINSLINITASIHNNGYDFCDATYQLFYVDNSGAEVLVYQQGIHVDTGTTVTVNHSWLVVDPRTTLIGRIINGNPVEYDVSDNEATATIGVMLATGSSTATTCGSITNGVAKVVVSGGVPPFSILWSNGATTDSVFVGPGTYSVIVTDFEGFTASDTVTVSGSTGPAVTASASSSAVCIGAASTLTASGATSYNWMPGSLTGASVSVSPTSTTTYTVTGTSGICSATATVIVTVNPLPIVGSTASPAATVCSGSPLTLSGTGASTYTWTGGVTNSVAFVPASTATYTVTGTDANGCVNTSVRSITVNSLPVVGNTVSPSASVCSGTSVTLSGTGATTYAWTGGVTNGVAFVPASTTTYTVTGTNSNGCVNTTTQTITVTSCGCTSAPPVPVLSGPNAVCGMITAIYTATTTTAISYTWTVPSGMTITSGQGTSSLHTNVAAGTISGNITCTATNTCGTSAAGMEFITKKPQTPANISGPLSICGATTASYSIPVTFGATSYTWSVPTGISIISGQGTTTVTISIAVSFVAGNIAVSAVNACGSIPGTSLLITAKTPIAPVIITGATNVCGMTTSTYTTSGTASATSYIWTVPAWMTINSGQGTTGINVTANGSPASGTLSVAGVNACGTGTAKTITLTTAAIAPTTISGPSSICSLSSATYTTPALGTGYVYNWSLSNVIGWSITAGQGTTAITITGPSAGANTSGIVKVSATNSCANTSAVKSMPVTSCHSPIINGSGAGGEANGFSELYPNPATSEFKIDVTTDADEEVTVLVYDVLGNLVISQKEIVNNGTTTLTTNIENYKNGMYFVRLVDKDANTVYSQTVIKQ